MGRERRIQILLSAAHREPTIIELRAARPILYACKSTELNRMLERLECTSASDLPEKLIETLIALHGRPMFEERMQEAYRWERQHACQRDAERLFGRAM